MKKFCNLCVNFDKQYTFNRFNHDSTQMELGWLINPPIIKKKTNIVIL
jgi:hypothetical protein